MKLDTVSNISILWKKVLTKLENEIDKPIFNSFLQDSYIHSVNGDTINVACNSSLAATILKQQYIDLITEIVNTLTETNFKLKFYNSDDLKKEKAISLENDTQTYFKGCSLDTTFNFDSFVVGPSNKEAAQASLFVASAPGKCYNPLFIYGGSGLGKTHLLNAIGNFVKERNPSYKILYVTAQEFLYQYLDYVRGQDKNEQLTKYIKSFDVFLIDDIQMLKDKEKTLEFFFDIYQFFIQNKKQVVLTSDKAPSELAGMDARLVSRFMDGLTVNVGAPSQELCENILKKKIIAANLDVEDFDADVISLMAQKFTSSIRELNGALNRIIFIKNIQHATHIDLNLAYTALGNLINIKEEQNTINENKILNTVATYYSLSVNQITGKLKTGQITTARHVAIYLIRNMLDISLKRIGELFSNRDHTTIMHSISKVEELLKTDEQMRTAIRDLKKKISG